jgi:hypothetical protein
MPTAKELGEVVGLLAIAGVIGALILSVTFYAWMLFTAPIHASASDVSLVLYVWGVAALLTLPASVLGGVPSYFVLYKLGLFNLPFIFVIGAVVGWLVFLTDLAKLPAAACMATGAVSGFIAWLLLRSSNYSSKRTGGKAPPAA